MIRAILELAAWLQAHNIALDSVACVTIEFTGPDRAELASRILVQESGIGSNYIAHTRTETIAGILVKIVGRAL